MGALGAVPRVTLHTVYLRGDSRGHHLHIIYNLDGSHQYHVDGLLRTLTLAHQSLSGRGGKGVASLLGNPWLQPAVS